MNEPTGSVFLFFLFFLNFFYDWMSLFSDDLLDPMLLAYAAQGFLLV